MKRSGIFRSTSIIVLLLGVQIGASKRSSSSTTTTTSSSINRTTSTSKSSSQKTPLVSINSNSNKSLLKTSCTSFETMLRVRPSIVLFGDSITQEAFGSVDGSNVGWASLLSAAYSRRADVFNRGFSGYNSRHGVDLLPRMLPTTNMASSSSNEGGHNTLFWTIFFGANDATLPGQRQHVPLKEYSENIKKMVEMIQSHKSASSSSRIEVILITPPPVNPSMWESYCLTNFGERRGKRDLKLVQKYADKVREAGKQLSCPVLDLFEIFGSNNGDFFSDGLHLSSLGNKLVFEGLMNLIKRDFPSKAPLEEGGDVGLPLEDKLWCELC